MRLPVLILTLILCLAPSACVHLAGYQSSLDHREYRQGLDEARAALRRDPGDAEAAYWAGRFLLAQENAQAALPYLEQAAAGLPDDADAQFWLGVGYWGVMDFDRERDQYRKALEVDPDHFSANLYLAHALLDQGRWSEALKRYDAVLRMAPREPAAMLDRGVALLELGRAEDGLEQLRRTLDSYPDGTIGRRAATLLNEYGDYSYRNHVLGRRTVTLRAVGFVPGSHTDFAFGATQSLDVLGAILENAPDLQLHVVAYVQGDAALAKARAERVRSYLVAFFPGVSARRLHLSWFGRGEEVPMRNGSTVLGQSMNFFTMVP